MEIQRSDLSGVGVALVGVVTSGCGLHAGT